jgi:hypothetical protein
MTANPLSALIGCLAWIPLAVWIVSIVQWIISGDIDFLSGFLGIWLAIGLGYVAMNPPTGRPVASALTFLAIVVTSAMIPWLRNALNRRELRSIDVQALERALDLARKNPANPLVKFKVATLVYRLGHPSHALALAESCLASMPEQHFMEEHKVVKGWRQVVGRPDPPQPLECIECGHRNMPGSIFCAGCGAPVLLDRLRGRFVSGDVARKLFLGWIGMVVLLVGIPLASALSGALEALALLGLAGLAGAMIWLALRPTPKGAAI